MSFNKITIVGYLGRDPEVKYTPQGTAVCNLSVATTEKRKGSNGEAHDVTTWFRCTVWGKQAEICSQYLTKGKQVYLEGRLRQEQYTDRDGQPRTSLEVNVTDVQFLGGRNSEQEQSANGGAQQVAKAAAFEAQKPPQTRTTTIADESDIPF